MVRIIRMFAFFTTVLLVGCSTEPSTGQEATIAPNNTDTTTETDTSIDLHSLNSTGYNYSLSFLEMDALFLFQSVPNPPLQMNQPADDIFIFDFGSFSSNLLAINTSTGDTRSIKNIEPLLIDYTVLSRDKSKVYLVLKETNSWQSNSPGIQILNDKGLMPHDLKTPLIGPSQIINFPLTQKQLDRAFPSGATFGSITSPIEPTTNTCSDTALFYDNKCVEFITIESNRADNPEVFAKVSAKELVSLVKTNLENNYLSCTIIEYDRKESELDCLGGSKLVNARWNIAGFNFNFQLRVQSQNIKPYHSLQDTNKFSAISRDLKPLQFDEKGNAYLAAYKYSEDKQSFSNEVSLVQVSKGSPLTETDLLDLEAFNALTFKVLANGDIVYKWSKSSEGSGISLLRKGQHKRLYNTKYYHNLNTDQGSTLVVGSKVIRMNENDVLESINLSWNKLPLSNAILSSDGSIYGKTNEINAGDILDKWLPVYPYSPYYLPPFSFQDNYNPFDYPVYPFSSGKRWTNINNLGEKLFDNYIIQQTEINYDQTYLDIRRLSDRKIIHIPDYTNEENTDYEIAKFAYLDGELIFSTLNTQYPFEISVGNVDLDKLYQQQDASDLLTLHKLNMAEGWLGNVTEITSLPSITPPSDAPRLLKLTQSSSDLSRIILEFSDFMEKSSVENALTLTSMGSEVDFLPLWFNKSLHLIADTNGFGDNNDDTVVDYKDYHPYFSRTTYEISIDSNIAKDQYGRNLSNDSYPEVVKSLDLQSLHTFKLVEQALEISAPKTGLNSSIEYLENDLQSFFVLANDLNPARGYRLEFDILPFALKEENSSNYLANRPFRIENDYFDILLQAPGGGAYKIYSDAGSKYQIKLNSEFPELNNIADHMGGLFAISKTQSFGLNYRNAINYQTESLISLSEKGVLFYEGTQPSYRARSIPRRLRIDLVDRQVVISLQNDLNEFEEIFNEPISPELLSSQDSLTLYLGVKTKILNYRIDNMLFAEIVLDAETNEYQFTNIMESDFNQNEHPFHGLITNSTEDLIRPIQINGL